MDNQFILNNVYNDIIKNQKKVKTLEIGLKFLDFLYIELKDMEYSNNCQNLKIYNLKKKTFEVVSVNLIKFQHKLQYVYKEFLGNEYYSNFSWYSLYKIFYNLNSFFYFDISYTLYSNDFYRLYYEYLIIRNYINNLLQ